MEWLGMPNNDANNDDDGEGDGSWNDRWRSSGGGGDSTEVMADEEMVTVAMTLIRHDLKEAI